MTRNVYLGADFDSALNVSSPALIPAAVAGVWDKVQKSDFPGRARLIAQEVATALPDIVAFQELEWFRMQSPSDFVVGAAPNAEQSAPNGDMLTIMRDALAAAGLDYGDPVVVASHTDTELPGVDAQGVTFDLRMTDRDAVFVRPSLLATNKHTEDFPTLFTVPVGGLGSGIFIKLTRGFATVDLSVQGVPFTFVNTHLEVGGMLSAVQEGQAQDLVRSLPPLAGQVVMAGDFNSAADGSTTASYKTVTGAFADTWPEVNAADPGLTCCTDITAPALAPHERIDLVLTRGKVRAEAATRTGAEAQRTAGGLLPSDHLGVLTTLAIGQ
jgi:endonuclease/exonuclease/phosphatase family metal-dependent hydrolase